MSFLESVRSVLTKYATFSGRACRSEYWWFFLFYALVGIVAGLLDSTLGSEVGLVGVLSSLALFLPSLAVTARRLHDAGWSGWWLLTILPPIIFVFMKADDGSNDYGPNPLGEV